MNRGAFEHVSFEYKVVWVTGASSGIGEALATALLQRGAFVILSARRRAELERVAAIRPDRALLLPFEATDFGYLPAVVEQAWAWKGWVDLLINCAGVSQRSQAIHTSLEVYRRLMEIDYLAPVALTQLLMRRMVDCRAGHIAAVSSVAGKVGVPLRTGYCGAKHALVGYFDALRAEVEAAYGIRVSVILPGPVRTAIALNALSAGGSAQGRPDPSIENGMEPAVAAQLILAGLAQGKREITLAGGRELAALMLRMRDPESLFDMLAQEGMQIASPGVS